ncbi:MAG: type II secretion system F family protein [Lachnospiraceae bacterium]
MAEYTYVALNKEGKQKKGNITANDEADALKKIKKSGLTPLELREAGFLNKEINLDFGKKITPRDLSVFCRQFVSMVSAGVTIVDALSMLATQTENKTMQQAIKNVQREIGKGRTMADAMAQQQQVFPDIMISMVRAGEASGKLDTAFLRMSEHFEKKAKLQAMIKKAAIYPIIVAIVALAVVIVMLTVVIPSYSDMFESMGTDLPAITKAVQSASVFVQHYWWLLAAIVVLCVVTFKLYSQTDNGKHVLGSIARKLPVFGDLTIKTAASDFARTLSTLLYSGLSMNEALEIVSDTISNQLYKDALKQAQKEVERGVPLSKPIEECQLFPPMVNHMIGVGEETGDLEGMLNRMADYYDEEVEMATQSVMAAMEPMVILLLAGIVGVLIASIMAPMLQLYTDLDSL